MASYNYTLNRDLAIREAYFKVGVGVSGEPIDADLVNDASVVLNVMLKAWQAYGLKLWKRKRENFTLVSGKNAYTMGQKSAGTATTDSLNKLVDAGANFVTDKIAVGDIAYNITDGTSGAVTAVDSTTTLSFATDLFPDGDEKYEISSADVSIPRPLMIVECDRKDTSNNEVSMDFLTLNEYSALANKTSPGTPVNYHYDPTLNNGTFYVWPTPDATAATNYTISIVTNEPIADVDNSTDDFDFPSEWLEAIIYGLAYRLAPNHGLAQTERAMLKGDMNDAVELVREYDVEEGSVMFQVELR